MAKIINLKISNFRGIKNCSIDLNKDFICLIGRGDSGKSTLLEAISVVLSPSWNLSFNDTDFYDANTENTILIEVSLIEIPLSLMVEDKFGTYLRKLEPGTRQILDDVADELDDEATPVLTISLSVDHSLEPQWRVLDQRHSEPKTISASERALFNCYLVSDYVDRHFSWNKGNPLYSLLRAMSSSDTNAERNVVIESMREAKRSIDLHNFEDLQQVTDRVKSQAANFGLNLENTRTTIDFRDLSIRDGKISLHDQAVPFRMKGKGSKRLSSLAIQSALVSNGGIMLVDEIEQGLEPDRIKSLIRAIKDENAGQIFITTHSREVITELICDDLLLIIRDPFDGEIATSNLLSEDGFQSAIRACSEAFFAKNVIVCEGKTEIGLCRALDKYRKDLGKPIMSFKDCAYVLGEGRSLVEYVLAIKEAGFKTSLLCDDDDPTVKAAKPQIMSAGVQIFQCEEGYKIEEQLFMDLPWEGIMELIEKTDGNGIYPNREAMNDSIRSKLPQELRTNPSVLNEDSSDVRTALSKASASKEWFKRIDRGEIAGQVVFKYFDSMDQNKGLRVIFDNLSTWIDA